MKDDFADALAFTLSWEGGYAKVADDPGGETYRGISRRAHPDWSGWNFLDRQLHPIPHNQVYPELEASVAAFYREHYWDPTHGDFLHRPLALALFDWAVHSGVANAVSRLQKGFGVNPDGVMGPDTHAAIDRMMHHAPAAALIGMRRIHWGDIVRANPKMLKFDKGVQARFRKLEDTLKFA